MNLLGLLSLTIIAATLSLGAPRGNVKTYSIATGRGSILRPGFDTFPGFVKRSTDNILIDAEQDLMDLEKRSAALGRSLWRPAKRSMAMGRSGFRPGKRSIATGRAGFRPGKRSAAAPGISVPIQDAEKLLLLQDILDSEIAANEAFIKQFSSL